MTLRFSINILFTMIFLHIVDDYYLQGVLAKMKQKMWWKDLPNYTEKYNKDYIAALLAHAFSWSFMVHICMGLECYNTSSKVIWACSIIFHTIIHAFVDNLKANKLKINLVQDQIIHIVQIFIIWITYAIMFAY